MVITWRLRCFCILPCAALLCLSHHFCSLFEMGVDSELHSTVSSEIYIDKSGCMGVAAVTVCLHYWVRASDREGRDFDELLLLSAPREALDFQEIQDPGDHLVILDLLGHQDLSGHQDLLASLSRYVFASLGYSVFQKSLFAHQPHRTTQPVFSLL